jgi:hypothetical protein
MLLVKLTSDVTPFRRGFHLAEQCKSLSRFLVVESIECFHSRISLERWGRQARRISLPPEFHRPLRALLGAPSGEQGRQLGDVVRYTSRLIESQCLGHLSIARIGGAVDKGKGLSVRGHNLEATV